MIFRLHHNLSLLFRHLFKSLIPKFICSNNLQYKIMLSISFIMTLIAQICEPRTKGLVKGSDAWQSQFRKNKFLFWLFFILTSLQRSISALGQTSTDISFAFTVWNISNFAAYIYSLQVLSLDISHPVYLSWDIRPIMSIPA